MPDTLEIFPIRIETASGGAEYCSSCTPTGIDVLCEDFVDGGDNYACTGWTEIENDSGVVSVVDPHANFTCTDFSKSLQCTSNNTTAHYSYAEWNRGSGQGTWYIKTWFMVKSHTIPTSSNGGYGPICLGDGTWAVSGGSAVASMFRTDSSDNLFIRFNYNNFGNTVDSGTISLNTQYELYVKYVSGTNLTIELNGSSVFNGAINANSPRYLEIGNMANGNNYAITMEFLGVAVDDSAEPPDCTI